MAITRSHATDSGQRYCSETARLLRLLWHKGYRLNRTDLPGRSDVAFIVQRKVIFVHGCFLARA
ncbi:hypothetical protein [Cupriavidus metallidurans]